MWCLRAGVEPAFMNLHRDAQGRHLYLDSRLHIPSHTFDIGKERY